MVFLARTEPAQSMAKPSCMENTRYAEKRRYVLSTAYCVAVKFWAAVANWVQIRLAAPAAFDMLGPKSCARSAEHAVEPIFKG